MKLLLNERGFYLESSWEQRHVVKAAGFRWDPQARYWWTPHVSVAMRFADYAANDAVRARFEEAKQAEAASRAAEADIYIPVPAGLEYMPFQKAGIAYALSRAGVLIADQMGLGKTIQAIGVINANQTLQKVLVICPASLKLNWERELNRWLVRRDYLIQRLDAGDDIHWGFGATVVVTNYESVVRGREKYESREWDLVIVDEAHYLKNPKSQRSLTVLGGSKSRKSGEVVYPGLRARRRLMLTGTPIANRPVELWPLIHWLDPREWSDFWPFARRYTGAHQSRFGWDFSGAANLPELQTRLRQSLMVRRLKEDVLTELPAKRRQVVELSGYARQARAEVEAFERHKDNIRSLRAAVALAKAGESDEEYRQAVQRLRDAESVAFTEIARLRHETAMAKVPTVLQFIHDAIDEDPGYKVLVFAHHHDVIDAITDDLGPLAVSLTGRDPMGRRQEAVDRFQSDPGVQVFVGSIQAAGVGLTLTAGAHVMFAELDWVPGNVSQAEDRAHRIGQTESVLVQHLVVDGSLDARMIQVILAKQDVIDKALDSVPEMAERVPLWAADPEPQLDSEPSNEQEWSLSPEQVRGVHSALRLLAGVDGDYASERNDMGFNAFDTAIGHSLAEASSLSPKQAALGLKLIRKYRRQLPGELLQLATGGNP